MSRMPEIAATYARLVLQSGLIEPAELLRGTSLSEGDIAAAEFLAAADLAVLFVNFDKHVEDPTWAARLGAQLNVAAHGPLGFAALSAPTLGEALDVLREMLPARNTTMEVQGVTTDSDYALEFHDIYGDQRLFAWIIEVVMKIGETLLESILGHPVGKNVVLRLAREEPDYAQALADCYNGKLLFAQPVNSIAVPLAWRQLPSPLYDEAVYRANLIKCREQIVAREQSGSLAAAVANRLRNHFDSQGMRNAAPLPPPTLEQMAEAFHMAPRTLIRRLQKEDASYKVLLEDLRREYAAQLLRDARLTAADVAEILGYREAANFGRAFRRWFGQSPAAWRRSSDGA